MAISSSRLLIPPAGHLADANTVIRHPAERGAWIWHPDAPGRATAVLRFRLLFTLQTEASPLIHVSGDQRFQLRCDGVEVTFGPDRCDVEHWTVQSVRMQLAPGEHELEALVWYIGQDESGASRDDPKFAGITRTVVPPMAQMSWRGGFLLFTEDLLPSLINTGEAPWSVEGITNAVEMTRPVNPNYLDVGPCYSFDLQSWNASEAKPAVVIQPPLTSNVHGIRRPGWCLFPAELPEQRRQSWTGGTVRATRTNWSESPYFADDTREPQIAEWQGLLGRNAPVHVPSHSKCSILWDLKEYRCGYPSMALLGGKDAIIEWDWAESLYEAPSPGEVTSQSLKGNRNEIDRKVFFGFGDRWIVGADDATEIPSLWWRCGRYARVRVATGDTPLTITRLGLMTTGYPLDRTGDWSSSDPSWDRLMPLFENAFRCSAHETWTDSPYYEQLSYLGDDRMHACSNYAWFGDTRLSRRSIQLFDWSRRASGMVTERYPSDWRQESATFALLWPGMIRDYAWWCDDAPFIKGLLPGLRSLLAEFEGMVHPDSLLHHVPGWPFLDWPPSWYEGCATGMREGDSSIVNLLWTLALLSAGQIEEAFGDPILAGRCRLLAGQNFDSILARYWDEERGLLLDTHGSDAASEHAQVFALLTGLLDAQKTEACLAALRNGTGLVQATISASFYVLDALYAHGTEDEFHRRLQFWRTLPDFGFTSTPEMPEPSRSDAHAWGAHPAWHTLASIAGVRPAAAGFARVRIAPLVGSLSHFKAVVAHPKGTIQISFARSSEGSSRFAVILPDSIAGDLVFGGETRKLLPGENQVELPAPQR